MLTGDVVVVGAGPSGVSAAVALKDAGVRPLLVDRADEVGASWRGRYDRLRLNTSRGRSHLPGRRFAKGTPRYPLRDDVVEHLERHAREDGIDLQLGTPVERIARSDDHWALATPSGGILARQVVVATGFEHQQFIPDWPGREEFPGELIHSGEYRNAELFRGRTVLVVGTGCSGMEIAYDLTEGGAAQVWLSARTPPNIVLREGPAGIPGDVIALMLLRVPTRLADAIARLGRRMDFGDLSEYGLPIPEEGPMARLERLGVAPAIVDPEVIEAIKARRVAVVAGVEAIDGGSVRLADGASVEPDAVICATGYRRGLEQLVGDLDVLDDRGLPRARGPVPAAEGLRFIGYTPRPAQLGYAARQARLAARAIARELR